MAKANSKFLIFRDPTFWDDNFEDDWTAENSAQLDNSDGDVLEIEIDTGQTYASISKDATFYADIDHYIIIKCTELTATSWRVYVRKASDSSWNLVAFNTNIGIKSIDLSTAVLEKLDKIRIRVDGSAGEHVKLDYVAICHRTYLEIQPQIKGQPSCEIIQRLLSSGVSAVHDFQIDNNDGTYTDAIRPNDILLVYLWREGDSEKKMFGGRIVEPGGSGDASTNTFLMEFEAYGHEQVLQSGEQLVQERYSGTNGRTIITDALSYCPQITDKFVDTDEEITSVHTFDKDEEQPFDIINEVCRQAKTLGGVVGFDAYVDPAGNCHVFKRGKNISSLTPSTMTLYSYKISRDTLRVRNKIPVYGKNVESKPSDKDSWTESIGDWTSNGTLSFDTSDFKMGTGSIASIKYGTSSIYVEVTIPKTKVGRFRDQLKNLNFFIKWYHLGLERPYSCHLEVKDSSGKTSRYYGTSYLAANSQTVEWESAEAISIGPDYEHLWEKVAGQRADWDDIVKIRWTLLWDTSSDVYIKIDGLHFSGQHFQNIAEDVVSQDKYGTKCRKPEVDDSLTSDLECEARAQGLLEFLAYPSTKLSLVCEGDNGFQVGDKLRVTLSKEDVDDWLRILEVKHKLYGTRWDTHLTLSNEPEYVDYVFAMTGVPRKAGATVVVDSSNLKEDGYFGNIQEAIDVIS